jgi:hypothetical protein
MTPQSTMTTDLMTASPQPTELLAVPSRGVCYVADASVSDEGLGHHLERTVWDGVSWQDRFSGDVNGLLAQAARVAAEQYVERIGKMTLGVLGPVRSARHKNTVYFSPFGFKVLKIMGFGDIEQRDCEQPGELSTGVQGGFLMARHAEDTKRGRLYFRWRWLPDSQQEVFETEVRDYTPRLMGRKGRWWGRLFYRLTQVNFHKLVMWGYHGWVRRHRESLLLQAAKQLENRTLGTTPEGQAQGGDRGHERLTTDVTPT